MGTQTLDRPFSERRKEGFSEGRKEGIPDYLQKLKVPEGYEKMID